MCKNKKLNQKLQILASTKINSGGKINSTPRESILVSLEVEPNIHVKWLCLKVNFVWIHSYKSDLNGKFECKNQF